MNIQTIYVDIIYNNIDLRYRDYKGCLPMLNVMM